MRISATDWVKGGWDIEQSIEFARRAKELGIDLIDVSSGALVPDAKVPVGKGFQVPFAKRIRAEAKIKTAAVGRSPTWRRPMRLSSRATPISS
jgi:2,4-dienoyl-CoA reductase-like NADH-dependent reductase (Old Yellow Enzyme family)